MKSIIITLASAVLTLSAFAQGAIDTYFSKYENSDDFTKVTVSAKMFELFTHIEGSNEEEQEMLETIAKLKGMRMLVSDGQTPDNAIGLYKDACDAPRDKFEELMTIQDDLEDFTFFIREESGIINELLLIGHSEKEFFIMSLLGDIDLKEVSKLSRSLQIDGMQHLNRLEE